MRFGYGSVSINSTSGEGSGSKEIMEAVVGTMFPLIPLPVKEAVKGDKALTLTHDGRVSINSTSGEGSGVRLVYLYQVVLLHRFH